MPKQHTICTLSRTSFFLSFFLSLDCTIRLILFSCLHRHRLKWKLQPVVTESGTDDRCFKIDLHNVDDQEEYQMFSTVNKQFLFYLVKVQTEPDVCTLNAVCFRDLRINYKTERIASDNFSLFIIKEKRSSAPWVNIHNLPQRRQELFFLSHYCARLEKSWSYLPDVKLLPKIQFSNYK